MRNLTPPPAVSGNMARFISSATVVLILCLGLVPHRTNATTVVPPEFDSLVSQADYVVHTVVKSVKSELQVVQGQKRIVTFVTVQIRNVITGSPPDTLVLQMLGGTVGSETMVVEGAPQFQIGDEDILFIHGNGTQLSPLVAIMHGRYPVVHDPKSNNDYVARNNGQPLYSEQEVSLSMEQAAPHPAGALPLTKEQFINRIRLSHQSSSNRNQAQR